MVHLGGLTPPASQAKSGSIPKRNERSSGGVSLSVVRVTALVDRAIARLERRSAALLFASDQGEVLSDLAKIELRFLSRARSALSGLAATVENDSVILETLQMSAHDTEAMVAELELNDVVRLRCLVRQCKTMIPELRARGIDCAPMLQKLNDIRNLLDDESMDVLVVCRDFSVTALEISSSSSVGEKSLLDQLLAR